MKTITRRDFLRVGAASVAAAGVSKNAWAKPKSDEFIEALVIGSGFGGSIAALRLAQAGVNTVVLERGRRWPITPAGNTFATFQAPDGRSSWLSPLTTDLIPSPIDIYPGVLELIDPTTSGPIRSKGIAVSNGAGVGGGSLAYNAIMLQPRKKAFEAVFPSNVKYDEMAEVYYPRVRQMLGHELIPNSILNTSFYGSTRANLTQAQNAGMFHGSPVEYNVSFSTVQQEINGTRVPSAIDGQSWFGLNSGAKKSTDRNYLALAEATGKVQVLPLHWVSDITEFKNEGLYQVTAHELNLDGEVIATKTFTCKNLFMAAGATGTPALLTKAREKGTMPRLNNSVGTDWGGNGDFIAVRGGLGSFLGGLGGPCGHILFEDQNNPFSTTNMVELVIPKNFQLFALGNAPGFSLYVGLGFAPALGYFTYDPATDSTTINWPNTDKRLNTYSAGVNSMLNRLNAANPGSFTVFNTEDPGYKASGAPALTAHPVGGVPMGKACDFSGRVHGHNGLYIVDGSIIPGGNVGGVNPSFTIAALAERTMDTVIDRDF